MLLPLLLWLLLLYFSSFEALEQRLLLRLSPLLLLFLPLIGLLLRLSQLRLGDLLLVFLREDRDLDVLLLLLEFLDLDLDLDLDLFRWSLRCTGFTGAGECLPEFMLGYSLATSKGS